MAKITTVELHVPGANLKQEFASDHAFRLLKMQNNGGWELPKNSKYELTDNGFRLRTDKREVSKSE